MSTRRGRPALNLRGWSHEVHRVVGEEQGGRCTWVHDRRGDEAPRRDGPMDPEPVGACPDHRPGVGGERSRWAGDRRRHRAAGGKSELHRAGCRVTPGRGDPEESATESRPPGALWRDLRRTRGSGRGASVGPWAGVRVKGCVKRAPALSVTRAARQTPSEARPRRKRLRAARPRLPGWSLEAVGNGGRR